MDIKTKYDELNFRIDDLAKDMARLEELRSEFGERNDNSEAGEQLSQLWETTDETSEQLMKSLLEFDLKESGKELFVDTALKLRKVCPEYNFYGADVMNKLYNELHDVEGVKKLIESDDKFLSSGIQTSKRYKEEYIDQNLLHELIIDALHEKAAGKDSKIFDNTFNTFYNTVALCAIKTSDNDFLGKDKNFLKTIYHDEAIPQEYKNQLKRAVENFKFQHRGELSALDKVKLGAGFVASIPGLAIRGAGILASGVIKTAGKIVNFATQLAAVPTELVYKSMFALGHEAESTAGKAAAYTAGTIFAVPTGLIKYPGELADNVSWLGGTIVDKTLGLVSYPLTMPLRRAVYSCVGNLPSVKKSKKTIASNIQKLILENNPRARVNEISCLYCSLNEDGKKLVVAGQTKENDFEFEFEVGSREAAEFAYDDMSEGINGSSYNIISGKNILSQIKDGDVDDEDLQDFLLGKVNSTGSRRQANAVANITAQKPVTSQIDNSYHYDHDM